MEKSRLGYIRRVANDTEAPNRSRELREARGLKQDEFARMIHVTPSALNKIELGSRGLDLQWMIRIATGLTKVTPHDPVNPADLLPRSANPYLLNEDERALIDARRQAEENERARFDKVAEAMLEYRGPDQSAA